jgi:hypothetical protein
MKVDEKARTVTSRRGGASLEVCLDCEAGLSFHLTDLFDTPYNEGNPPEYHENRPNQWHFKASTERLVPATRIAAAMIVRGPLDKFSAQWKQHPGWSGVALESAGGAGELWAQMVPGAAPPLGVPGPARLAGFWRPVKGDTEGLTV